MIIYTPWFDLKQSLKVQLFYIWPRATPRWNVGGLPLHPRWNGGGLPPRPRWRPGALPPLLAPRSPPRRPRHSSLLTIIQNYKILVYQIDFVTIQNE